MKNQDMPLVKAMNPFKPSRSMELKAGEYGDAVIGDEVSFYVKGRIVSEDSSGCVVKVLSVLPDEQESGIVTTQESHVP